MVYLVMSVHLDQILRYEFENDVDMRLMVVHGSMNQDGDLSMILLLVPSVIGMV